MCLNLHSHTDTPGIETNENRNTIVYSEELIAEILSA